MSNASRISARIARPPANTGRRSSLSPGRRSFDTSPALTACSISDSTAAGVIAPSPLLRARITSPTERIVPDEPTA